MKFNKVVLFLTLSDIFTWGFFTILSSLSGIYLSGKIEQDVVRVVGTGTAIYLFTNGIVHLPAGLIGDKIKKDKDEIIMLMVGNILMGLPFLFYPIISTPTLYYILQFIFGVGSAINIVNWRKLFAKNLNGSAAGGDYGIYGAVMNVLTAGLGIGTGYLGNLSAQMFDIVIVSIGLIMILSAIFGGLIFSIENRLSATADLKEE